MTHKLLIPLLVLSAFVSSGTEAEVREAVEQAVPAAVSPHAAAVQHLRHRRWDAEDSPTRSLAANTARGLRRARDLVTTATAPHGRPDNTRGDPASC